MYTDFKTFLATHSHLSILQAENPDGDSLGSAIALDYILQRPDTTLYTPVEIPGYLHYFPDWSRVSLDFDYKADGYIIVDTAANILLSKLLDDPAIRNCLYRKPVFVLDHHESADDLEFPHQAIIEPRPACADLIYQIAKALQLEIPQPAAAALYAAISADTLGLVSPSVNADTMFTLGELIRLGASPSGIDEIRREYMKKSPRILDYKADLIKRIDYSLDNALATVHIPFAEIHEYSNEYNPNVLILEEMRMVKGVLAAVAIKTYPDGKLTGKVRTSLPIAEQIAGYFGGGGHQYAAGFRVYDLSYEDALADLVSILPDLIASAQAEPTSTTVASSVSPATPPAQAAAQQSQPETEPDQPAQAAAQQSQSATETADTNSPEAPDGR